MKTYPKINTIWARDETGRIQPGNYSNPVVGTIDPWLVTEKVDGTNVRIGIKKGEDLQSSYLERGSVGRVSGGLMFGGKTDNAHLPPFLVEFLQAKFTFEKLDKVFSYLVDGDEVVLFGEGYGPRINKGGKYSDEVGFVLFDVFFDTVEDPLWSKRPAVLSIAKSLGCESVHTYGIQTKEEAIEFVKNLPDSHLAMVHGKDTKAEGIVARPLEPLLMQNGDPLMWKLKVRDFRPRGK